MCNVVSFVTNVKNENYELFRVHTLQHVKKWFLTTIFLVSPYTFIIKKTLKKGPSYLMLTK
jgi:hypothetical protein